MKRITLVNQEETTHPSHPPSLSLPFTALTPLSLSLSPSFSPLFPQPLISPKNFHFDSVQVSKDSSSFTMSNGRGSFPLFLSSAGKRANLFAEATQSPLKKRRTNVGGIEHNRSLVDAARSGLLGVVHEKITNGIENINEKVAGSTALHFAAFYNHLTIVRLLIDSGAEIDVQNDAGATPLMWSVDRGYSSIVRTLLKAGCNVDVSDFAGTSTLHKAVLNGNLEIVGELLQKTKDFNPKTTDEGLTPLHTAALHGRLDILTFLISHDSCDVNARSHRNATALHKASSRGYNLMVEALLERGAQVDPIDWSSRTPLYWACFHGHIEVIKVLLKFKADPFFQDQSGVSPRFLLEERGDEAALCLFLVKESFGCTVTKDHLSQ